MQLASYFRGAALKVLISLFIVLFCSTSGYAEIPWPFAPADSAQPLGNSYGEYQNYGGAPYLHPGIDIMQPAGSRVYAVKAGWVKAVLTTAADFHWRVAIGDSPGADSCDGWLYAHLERTTIAVVVGEHADSGQYLGDIVAWPVAGFNHCHFVKIRGAGFSWSANWLFVGNPLDDLVNIDDFDPPYFVNITGDAPLRFCVDNSTAFFPVSGAVSGNVDIIAEAHDRIGHPTWVLTPYAMGYEIYSDSVQLGPYTSFIFGGQLLWDQVAEVVFKAVAPCNSLGDYEQRQFFEIITNHDNDSLVEPGDTTGKWATGQIPNDTYTVKVWARDRYGNIAWDSMGVTTANYYNITGTVITSDGCPIKSGSVVIASYSGDSDTTAADGGFALPSQPAGRYSISVSRPGYITDSSVYEMFGARNLEIVLDPAPFVYGDVDHSGSVDISDVVYLISFIFSGGSAPAPWAAALHINGDASVDISDVVYLIAYIFAGGSPPGG
jgi:hypothetical protein